MSVGRKPGAEETFDTIADMVGTSEILEFVLLAVVALDESDSSTVEMVPKEDEELSCKIFVLREGRLYF